MNRKTKNTTPQTKRKLFQYSPTKLKQALNAIRSGSLNVLQATKYYSVPRSTLRNKLSGKSEDDSHHVGPKAVMGISVEKNLVDWIFGVAKMGFPINKNILIDTVQKIVSLATDVNTPFINGRPGRRWFEGFMRRHPEVSQKQSEYINKARGQITEGKIRGWFKEAEELLEENIDVLQDPTRVFNMDETSFYLYPKGYLVLAEKGIHVYDTSAKSDKENITTLITVSAAGVIAPPPLTVYKYKRMNQDIARSAPSYWGLGKTDSGWMTGEAFYEYFTNVFYPYLVSSKIKLPVIVFLDGHSSHLTMHLGKFCKENQIILVCLFPNTTHILQPLDVSVFAPLKAKWKSTVRQWRIDNDGKEICKQDVPTVLHTILNNSNFTNSIKSGFRVCGLFPWNADNVDYTKCTLKESPTKTSTQQSESTNLVYLKNFEKYIETDLLEEFYLTKDRNTDWEGSMTTSDLYDVWNKMLFDQNQNILQPSINCEANELQTINTPNDSASQLQIINT